MKKEEEACKKRRGSRELECTLKGREGETDGGEEEKWRAIERSEVGGRSGDKKTNVGMEDE